LKQRFEMSERLRTAIGVISGTSMDGIDIGLIKTDGREIVQGGPGRMMPYPAELRQKLQTLLIDPSIAERDPLTELEHAVTDAFTAAIAVFLRDEKIAPGDVDLIGLHGQTIYHRPERRFTRQLGFGQKMARDLGISVVDGMRQADVKAGGHGAPLVPLYHAALAADLPRPLMVLNLGGVGNVTYLGRSTAGEETILAFDTGPASALIDDYVLKRFGLAYDDGGRIAASGQVDKVILAKLMAHPFFAEKPPKSLDRQAFHAAVETVKKLSDVDAVATLTAFTIEATVAALDHVGDKPRRWLITGGGRHNASFMAGLANRLGVPVEPVEAVGWNGDLLEAQCFGYLAVRSTLGLPLSLPTTTGAPKPMTGGILWKSEA
jgi:anhydro-N-acetylmuramic acid kinase